MLVADQISSKRNLSHNREAEVASPKSHIHRKRQKAAPAVLSSSSSSSSSSSISSKSSINSSRSMGDCRKNTSRGDEWEKSTLRMKRELTPSTDPCTDSSEYEACETDGFPSSFKCYEEPVSDFSDSDRAEMVAEAEKRIAEEVAKFAATATDFSNHISEFLLRVGGLDLTRVAGDMSVSAIDPAAGQNDSASTVDQTPVEARLSRREINALYNEAEEVRVAGAISDEPSGRLVRFLNLLRVNIRDASSLVAPNPTLVSHSSLALLL